MALNGIEPYITEARSELSIAANYSRSLYPAMYATPAAKQAHVIGLTVKGAYLLIKSAFYGSANAIRELLHRISSW